MNPTLTNELIEELSSENPNILHIKILCRENPGLIASAGLRSKVWSLLLLGNNNSAISEQPRIEAPVSECDEQQVLEADVHRTRAEVENFRSQSWREALKNILQRFCLVHGIQYKQGMNEVLAPFLYIHPPPKSSALPYALFEAFLFRYLQRFMCMDDSAFLFKAFRLFHILLMYVDPQLALHLHEQDFSPELYSPQWFLTLYSRALPLPHVVRLWDMMIAMDDPSFTFFIGLCLLRKSRTDLLMSGADVIPEIITKLHFNGEEEIDAIVTEARDLYKVTPRCFLRVLRLCCVSTTELMPQPMRNLSGGSGAGGGGKSGSGGSDYSLSVHEFDKVLSVQAVRSCLMLSAQELVDSVAPMLPGASSSSRGTGERDTGVRETREVGAAARSAGSGDSTRAPPQQYVIIDIRNFQDTHVSGGGTIPRAMQLEPEFLQRPEALSIWMQHFDGTRGCNICIVDMPPARWTGFALWRRLLLGEGDGQSSNSGSGNDGGSSSNMYAPEYLDNADDMEMDVSGSSAGSTGSQRSTKSGKGKAAEGRRDGSSPDRGTTASGRGGRGGGGGGGGSRGMQRNAQAAKQQIRDAQSRHARAEEEAVEADADRPAILLAQALQANSFPNVSVLDGGFPALVEQLVAVKGTVEPVVINHDRAKWTEFLRNTGRDTRSSTGQGEGGAGGSGGRSRVSKGECATAGGTGNSAGGDAGGATVPAREPQCVEDLTQLQVYEYAMKMAARLEHPYMLSVLKARVLELRAPMDDVANITSATSSMKVKDSTRGSSS